MDVYIVYSHSYSDYPNENTVECVCLTENRAIKRIEDLEKAQTNFSRKRDYWYHNYDLDMGNLTLIKNNDDLIIIK